MKHHPATGLLIENQNRVLDLMLSGAPLKETLNALISGITEISGTPVKTSILLLSPNGENLLEGSSPSLPEGYNQKVYGLRIGPQAGSCGTAAHRREAVYVTDISTDHLWAPFKEIAAAYNLRACWSTPIMSSEKKVLGTFALYYEVPKTPSSEDQKFINFITKTAAVIIERKLEQEKLGATIDVMGDGFFNVDKNWVVTKVNTQVEKNVGKSRAELVGKLLWDAFPGIMDRSRTYYENYEKVLRDRIKTSFIDHYEPNDVWTEVDAYPEPDGGMSVFYRDLTEKKKFEAETRLSDERFRATFQHSYHGMCILSASGTVIDLNPAFAKMLGKAPESVVGTHVLEFTHPESQSLTKSKIEQLSESGEPFFKIEKQYLRADGSSFWAQSTVSAIFDEQRRPTTFIAVVEDITDRKKLESMEKSFLMKVSNERENFRNLFKQTPEMVCILKGPEHVFEFVNDAHITVLGFDATGMAVRVAQPESVEIHGILDNVYRTGVTAHLSEIAVTVGNSLRYFDLTYAARWDDQGNIDGVMILGTEISEKIKNRNMLAESEARFRTITNAMPQMVWSTLPDGTHDYANEKWIEFTGATPADLRDGNHWRGLIHPEDQQKTFAAFEHALRTGEVYEIEYRLRHKTGKFRWVLARAQALRDESGTIIQWLGTCTDIHDHKKIQADLEQAVAARDEFLSVASHELRTPLTSLKLQTQSMKRNFDKGRPEAGSQEKVQKLISVSEKQVGRLIRLVEDMLDFSRIQAGKLTIQKARMDVSELVEEVYANLLDQFETNGCVTSLEVDPKVMILGDHTRLEQVFTNLLTNSMKYGKGKPVAISLKKLSGNVVFSVKDQGLGIAPENQSKIFNRFERLVSMNEVSGLGLGLYITKEIVDAHEGQIEVVSELGKGAEFILTLPLEAT